ncbi:MAG: hypothetical protein CMB89_08305 [Flammeovirgaceae bacterium]|nr:hypothetical protein [Flammeovirgaceae bacterium]
MFALLSRFIYVFVLSFFCLHAFSQADGVGIGTLNVNEDAILEVDSEKKGLLIPRMNTSGRLGISATSGGLIVYDTEFQAFFYYDSVASNWKRMVEENSFGTVPLGGIIMWNGNSSNVPNGFVLCDEDKTVNGYEVPDLSERFVIGGSESQSLNRRVWATDTLESNYLIEDPDCPEYEYLWSGKITITEPEEGYPDGSICTALIGSVITYTDIPMDSCDHWVSRPLLIPGSVKPALICGYYDLTDCSSKPNPNYYMNNENCRIAAEIYKIAFIMRVE